MTGDAKRGKVAADKAARKPLSSAAFLAKALAWAQSIKLRGAGNRSKESP